MPTILAAALAACTAVLTTAHGADFELRATRETSDEALTTRRVWTLDPREPNPHRQRWVVERSLDLAGLEPYRRPDGRYGARASQLSSAARTHVRGPGPWFKSIQEFPCVQEPDAWFATLEGARQAAQIAAAQWEDIVSDRRVRLQLELDRISAKDADRGLARAQQLFDRWLLETEAEWSVKGRQKARVVEWRSYLETSSQLGLCKTKPGGPALARAAPAWRDVMEPPSDKPSRKLLARAPAKRWNGLFSIRMTLELGGQRLNGQFLVDSGASLSILNPNWILSQGVNPALIEVPGAEPRRVTWSGGSGVARRAQVVEASIGGHKLPVTEFLLMETDLFAPPEHLVPCCDGIIGVDVLRGFAVEFLPGPPHAVQLWAREGFSLGSGVPWVEASIRAAGDVVSACELRTAGARVPGVRWDTGSELAVDVHTPWQKSARAARGKDWRLVCDDLVIATAVPASFPSASRAEGNSPLQAKNPGLNVGMEILGRGPFTLDLGHGRVWFPTQTIATPILSNRSGLTVGFELDRFGERVLKVSSIRPGSPAARLGSQGLGVGSIITRVNSVETDDLDLWQVERALSGALGDEIRLQWKAPKNALKMAPLRLR